MKHDGGKGNSVDMLVSVGGEHEPPPTSIAAAAALADYSVVQNAVLIRKHGVLMVR
jgi:hypothetical protein